MSNVLYQESIEMNVVPLADKVNTEQSVEDLRYQVNDN